MMYVLALILYASTIVALAMVVVIYRHQLLGTAPMTSAIVTPTRRTLRSRIAAHWRAMLLRASIKRFEEHVELLNHELDKLPRSLYLTELHLADMRVRLALTELDL